MILNMFKLIALILNVAFACGSIVLIASKKTTILAKVIFSVLLVSYVLNAILIYFFVR